MSRPKTSCHSLALNESWKVTAEGPVRVNNEYDGEEYDARQEMKGWAAPIILRCAR